MDHVEIRVERSGVGLFGMDKYTYHNDSWGLVGFILRKRLDSGIYIPVERFPVLGLLYVLGLKFRDNNVVIPQGNSLNFNDLSGINFGYNTEESYRDFDDVLRNMKDKKVTAVSDGVLFMLGTDVLNLDDRVRHVFEPRAAA